jgi:O-6-methylguanine DNA methyltransferase
LVWGAPQLSCTPCHAVRSRSIPTRKTPRVLKVIHPVLSKCYAPTEVEILYRSEIDSPAGKLALAASERGLVSLEFAGRARGIADRLADCQHSPSATQIHLLSNCRQQLDEYFAGKRRDFTVPLDLRGTPFQLACWKALLAIPYGETRTYADIARAVDRPQGFRGVGLANNRNPIAIIVPCHRVIASDGTLCGYGGGLELKRKLLELECALAFAQPALIA